MTVGAYATYLAIVLGSVGGAPFTEVRYVPALLWTVGGAIGAAIALQVLGSAAKIFAYHRDFQSW
ncbi:hypothetical protein [Actinokineospora iranica]|uniref:hypothetical protein n=1 Tax=Actinokineospora iranica TaxID=1271860 RepID=UPI003898DF7B